MKNKTVNDINSLIRKIESCDGKNIDESLFNFVGNLLNGAGLAHSIFAAPIIPKELLEKGYGCYRTRKIKSIEEIYNVDHLWALKSEDVKSIGRCNKLGQSILYCSNHQATTFTELDLQPGDIYVSTRYETKLPIESHYITIIILGDDITKYYLDNEFNPDKHVDFRTQLNQKNRIKHDLIDRFVTRMFQNKVFNQNAHHYNITSAITNFYFNCLEAKAIELGGIIYPSVKAEYGSFNMAIKDEYARKNLEIRSSVFYKITSVKGTNYKSIPLGQVVNIDDSGNLKIELVG
jgi:hypothetical protein